MVGKEKEKPKREVLYSEVRDVPPPYDYESYQFRIVKLPQVNGKSKDRVGVLRI